MTEAAWDAVTPSSASSGSRNHPFPAMIAVFLIKALAVLFLCFHGVVGSRGLMSAVGQLIWVSIP